MRLPQPAQEHERSVPGQSLVPTVTPYEAAIAVSRAQQIDPALARNLLCAYARDGVDPLRTAYCLSRLLAKADQRIAMLTDHETGDWLHHIGLVAAQAAPITSPDGQPSSPPPFSG